MPSMFTSIMRNQTQALLLCLVLSIPRFASADGVTIITHGFAPDFLSLYSPDNPEWVDRMESAIENRLYEHFPNPRVSTGLVKFTQINSLLYTYNFQWITNHFSDSSSGEIVIIVDWADLAGLDEAVPTQTIAENAFAVLPVQAYQLPIHLIGHSRGTSVNTRLCELIGEEGIWVDQFTTLDPHPVAAFNDETVKVHENVLFADNYWRDDGGLLRTKDIDPKESDPQLREIGIPDVNGRSIDGAFNRNLGALDDEDDPDYGYYHEHSDTHLWYHGTIDTALYAFDGEHFVLPEMRYGSVWWNEHEDEGHNAGYIYSRIAGRGDDYRLTTDPPIVDGYHGIHGGGGSRYLLDWTNAVWPNVFKFEIEANGAPLQGWGPHQIQVGQPLDLKYEAQDNDSHFTVSLFVDEDRNPYNGYLVSLDHLTDTHAATGQGWYHPTKTWNTGGFVSAGTDCYVYAKITDGTHTRYFYATPKLHFVAVPTYTISSSAGSHGS
ncbi:MAG TPA: hypothetical protein PKH10_13015, partial [bacterium]|nr:hypothetical protein [bacterium]